MRKNTAMGRVVATCVCVLAFGPACGDDEPGRTHEPATGEDDAGPSLDSGSTGADPLRIAIADGELQGESIEGSRRFLKIPYAKPPLAELRWRAPVDNEAWDGVRREREFADPCPQASNTQNAGSTQEDCLYLNVWAPDPAPKRAPVMVWIHGGGNINGSAADKLPVPGLDPEQQPLWYDGKVFAAQQGVVLVTFNYRLGAFGYFAHPGLAGEGSPRGNQGLLDQQQALRWVARNIAKFGGDPDNVTIFGESGGSADVCYHVVSPGSRGLFQRAISESGGCTTSIATTSLGIETPPWTCTST